MQPRLTTRLASDALRMALNRSTPKPGLLHHSDRGSQYASRAYQAMLRKAGMRCSMSRKGNCWDNAPVESFFSTLKRERVHQRRYNSAEEARSDLFVYIETWYNRKRIHSSIGYNTPIQFEQQYYQRCLT